MSQMTVAIIGHRAMPCGYCVSLASLLQGGALEKALPGAVVVDADKGDNPAAFAKWRKAAGSVTSVPVIAVFDGDGKFKGKFVARRTTVSPFTAAGIAAKIKSLCPSCCADGSCEIPAEKTKTCPTCKGSGKVLALFAAALTFLSGCVNTSGSFTAPDGTKVEGKRWACLYPFKMGGAELVAPAAAGATAGKFSITGYETDGGAAGVVSIIDSAGNVIGVMAAKGAKAVATGGVVK